MAIFTGMAMDDTGYVKNKWKYNKDNISFGGNYNSTYWPRLEGGTYSYKVYFYEGDSNLGYPDTNSGTRLFGTDGKIYMCYSGLNAYYGNMEYRPITGKRWHNYFKLDSNQTDISGVVEWPETEEDGTVRMYSRRKASVKDVFPYTYGTKPFSITKQHIFEAIKAAMDILTALNFGVTFTHVGGINDYFETTIDETYNDPFDVYGKESGAPEKRYSIMVTGYLGKRNGESYYPSGSGKIGKVRIRLMDYYSTLWDRTSYAASIRSIQYAHTALVFHEVLHTLGFGHEHLWEAVSAVGGGYDNDKLKNYGNRNIEYMPISNGIIHRTNQTSLYNQLGDNEDKLCGLDVIYNNSTNVTMKITGNIHVDYKNFYETGKCQALLADKYGVIRYRMAVDKTGYFEFRIRIRDWSSVDPVQGFYLIVVSEEFFYKCLYGEKNSDGTWEYVNKPDGTLTYGLYPTRITALGNTSISGDDAIKMNKTVTSFVDLYDATGIYFLYKSASAKSYTSKGLTLIAKDKKINLEMKEVPGCHVL